MPNFSNITDIQGQWHYPTSIRFGVGKIEQLAQACRELNISKPLIVTDSGLANLPLMAQIVTLLNQQQLDPVVFSDVKPNPTGSNIEAGVHCFHQNQRDGVIAVGGGSGLDAGKAIALMMGQERPIWDFEDVADNYTRVNEEGIAPIIAVPTTSGTGSEVGRASVIVDEQSANQHANKSKKIIFHPKMLPQIVIADPALTQGLPASVTAATGLDAFVHNLEAYCAPGYHPMAEAIALEGMRLIKNHLPTAFNNGSDLVARSHMMVASSMGATAFQKGLGGVHALAHPIGANYDAHHGLLNAILLPYVLRKNRPAIESKIAEIAYYLKIEQANFDGFMAWLQDFNHQLEIPTNLAQIGIDDQQAAKIGQQAQQDPSAGGNPIQLTAQEYQTLFQQAVNGQ